MRLTDRADGTHVTKAPTVRLFMPYLLPRRGDAVVYFEQKIDTGPAQAYLARWNAGARPPLR